MAAIFKWWLINNTSNMVDIWPYKYKSIHSCMESPGSKLLASYRSVLGTASYCASFSQDGLGYAAQPQNLSDLVSDKVISG